MSAPEVEPTPRVDAMRTRLAGHNGPCSAIRSGGKCACDLYEHKAHMDGFDTCMCNHTRWSHGLLEVVPMLVPVR